MRTAIVASAAFTSCALLVAFGVLRSADRAILDGLRPLANPVLDLVSSLFSAVGGLAVTTAAALVMTLLLFCLGGRLLAAAPLLMFVGVAVESVLKKVIEQPPPPPELLRDAHWLAIGAIGEGGNAFPSGHLTRTTFLALVAASRWPWARWLAAVLVPLMAFTRIYSASHWASDVIGGLCLGTALAGVAAWLAARERR